MYYDKAEALFRLAVAMQGAADGLNLNDIETDWGVSRRTAERMRDAVLRIFPQALAVGNGETRKRWRIPAGTINGLIAVSAEELAGLRAAVALLKRDGRKDAAATIQGVEEKLHALLRSDLKRRVETDLEALTEAEGLAMRPGPRVRIDPEIIGALRGAILARHKVRIRYRTRTTGGVSWHKVCPYGFLYGNRPYLVAYSLNPAVADYRTFRLSNILAVSRTGEPYEVDSAFSLDAYARRSFGVFQEEPFDVAWKFTPLAAKDAREYVFHPDQTTEDFPDGSLVVRFRAGGAREMSWHLYTWGDAVEVLEPRNFWKRMRR